MQQFRHNPSLSASHREHPANGKTSETPHPREPLQTEEDFLSIGKSGCREREPVGGGNSGGQRVIEERLSSSKRILPTYSEQRKTHPR